jgi:hypothetical protein
VAFFEPVEVVAKAGKERIELVVGRRKCQAAETMVPAELDVRDMQDRDPGTACHPDIKPLTAGDVKRCPFPKPCGRASI